MSSVKLLPTIVKRAKDAARRSNSQLAVITLSLNGRVQVFENQVVR
jgi:hypothetical protein